MKTNKSKKSKIYLEAILDAFNNCERLDHSRIFKVNPEKLFMRLITENNVVVMTYDYWNSLDEKCVDYPTPKRTVILIDEIDLKRVGEKEYNKNKKEYGKLPRIEFREVKQYTPFIIHELQSNYKDLDIFILGDSRLYWKCFDLADSLIITHVDTVSESVPKRELIEFPKIESSIWRESMATILDDLSYAVEYERKNIKGWED